MVTIDLNRIYKTDKFTIGKLYINNKYFCDTIEDKVRLLNSYEDKVYGETAIPIGRYKVILSYSNHFKRKLPEILNVDFFKGIRIHEGNTEKDSSGCIIVGECKNKEEGYVYNSKNTMKKLMEILEPAYNNNEEIIINVY